MDKYAVIIGQFDSHHTDVYLVTDVDAALKLSEDVNVELRERVQELSKALCNLYAARCQVCGCPNDDCRAHPANAAVLNQAARALSNAE